MSHGQARDHDAGAKRRAFTLVEMMVSIFIFFITLAGAIGLFLSYRNAWVVASLARNTSSEASVGLERIVYGMGTNSGLRAVMFSTVSASYPAGGWRLDYHTNRFLAYSPANDNIVDENGDVLCEQVVDSTMVMTNSGCSIMVTIMETGGGRMSTNSMSSFVQFRN